MRVQYERDSSSIDQETRRKFDLNFKREAVALWQNSGKPAREIAQQLGIVEHQSESERSIPLFFSLTATGCRLIRASA